VHRDSIEKALFSPLAQHSPAGFLFLADGLRGIGEGDVEIAFEKAGGLLPAIIQDHCSGEVLMLGFMNSKALAETQRTGEVVFFSRSRNKLWKKGESSGHVLKVRELRIDCDADSVLVRVEPAGPGVCHEGYRSCFFRTLEADGEARVSQQPTFSPEKVYGKENRGTPPKEEGR
jgi:phosphoribosyl-AMP cyclohydrolase